MRPGHDVVHLQGPLSEVFCWSQQRRAAQHSQRPRAGKVLRRWRQSCSSSSRQAKTAQSLLLRRKPSATRPTGR